MAYSGGAGLSGGGNLGRLATSVANLPFRAQPGVRKGGPVAAGVLQGVIGAAHGGQQPKPAPAHPSGGVGLPYGTPGVTGPGTQGFAPQPGGTGGSGGQTPTVPPPPSPSAASAAAITPALDATALGNIATHNFTTGNQINSLGLQAGYADTDYQRALAQLAHAEPLQERQAQERANNAGLLSSTALANNLGEIGYQTGERRGTLADSHQRTRDRIAGDISGLQGGIPLYNDEQAAGSAARLALIAAKDPTLGAPGAPGGTTGGTTPGGNVTLTPPGQHSVSVPNATRNLTPLVHPPTAQMIPNPKVNTPSYVSPNAHGGPVFLPPSARTTLPTVRTSSSAARKRGSLSPAAAAAIRRKLGR